MASASGGSMDGVEEEDASGPGASADAGGANGESERDEASRRESAPRTVAPPAGGGGSSSWTKKMMIEAVASVEQPLLVLAREAISRTERVISGGSNLILSLTSGEDTAATDRQRFKQGNTRSVESSHGLQSIQSSFNQRIIDRYLQSSPQANSHERQFAAGSPQTPERSASGASTAPVESPCSPTMSEVSYFDEWEWEWEDERQVDAPAALNFFRGGLVTFGRYIFVSQLLQSIVRFVVKMLVYLYVFSVWLLSCVNISVKYFTHIHRPQETPSTAAAGQRQQQPSVGSSSSTRREHRDGVTRGGTLRFIDGVIQSKKHKQQRLGVLEEMTDRMELFFTGISAWIDGGTAAETDVGKIDNGPARSSLLVKPKHKEQIATPQPSSSYDNRTVADMVREAGYPCEQHQVLTLDGYFLQMFRIPRRQSRKGSVLFIHGVYDSAMAFVSGGLCSQPFAAYDNGFDVWLGNLRICSPWKKKGNDNNVAAAYWNFSINELAIYDCDAFVRHIESTRRAESFPGGEPSTSGATQQRPVSGRETGAPRGSQDPSSRRLQIVAHSLGGSVALLYLIWSQRMARVQTGGRGTQSSSPKNHSVSRLILLSPAGFHHHHPPVAVYLFVLIDFLFGFILRRMNFGLYLPTRIGRLLLHKLMQDVVNIPSLMALVNLVVGKFSLSDSSDFAAALHMPHLNPDAVVGCSYKLCLSLYRCFTEKRFVSFDNFNNRKKNLEQFDCPDAIDVAADYALISGIPVNITAGTKDGVIHADNIRCHFDMMLQAGVDVTYEEFDSGHLEFRANESRELRKYVLEKLLLEEE